MPEETSYDKLIDAITELTKENTFLQAKAKYFRQNCLAMDVNLNLAKKQIVELRSELRTLQASAI